MSYDVRGRREDEEEGTITVLLVIESYSYQKHLEDAVLKMSAVIYLYPERYEGCFPGNAEPSTK